MGEIRGRPGWSYPKGMIRRRTASLSWREITSGLPDASREEDERREERRAREMRARAERARAVAANTPGLAEVLARDWKKVGRFNARFSVTEETVQHGVPPS